MSRGLKPCSSKTGAYCRARKRLPEKFFATIARTVGHQLADQAEQQWLWKGRRVYMFDGTTISMPDTPSNQQAYPQSNKQTPGVGFPLARVAAIFSLSCGALLDLAVAGYSGKGQGEVTLLRQLWNLFRPGDVLLADSLMCNWRNLYELQERGVHVVTRLNKALRRADFRKGQRLGKEDHLVQWPKPHIREVGRKEIWTHVLAYNLIRTIIAQSATKHGISPRFISFKATMQVLEAFQPLIAAERSHQYRHALYEQLLDSIASHRIADRPNRFEPRLRKRRFKKYDYMMKPRNETKLDILKQLRKK